METVKKAKLSSKGQVTIPLDVRRALGLKEGDGLRFEVEGAVATLRLDAPEDPFAVWEGALRDGKGKSTRQIVEELREERGW